MGDAPLATIDADVKRLTRPDRALLTYYIVMSLAAVVASPLALLILYFHYHTLHYAFGDEGLSMGYGVLFRREMHLTYARIQDIHLSQNVLERWLGIGTVTVQSAGGGGAGNLRIAGVREFEAVRDFLYARMRGVHPTLHGPQALPGADSSVDREAALLVEIRDELRAAARALEGDAPR